MKSSVAVNEWRWKGEERRLGYTSAFREDNSSVDMDSIKDIYWDGSSMREWKMSVRLNTLDQLRSIKTIEKEIQIMNEWKVDEVMEW